MEAGTFEEKESVFVTTPSMPDDTEQAVSIPPTDDDFVFKNEDAEPGSTEVNPVSEETVEEDFPRSPAPGDVISTPDVRSSARKQEKISMNQAAKTEIPSTVTTDLSDKEDCMESTTRASDLKSSDKSSSSVARNKKTMMESMGLTEKRKETESTPLTRRTRGSVGRNNGDDEAIDTPSPGRKVRSSRGCSTPVWLDLIPKRNKKIKIEADETNISDRKGNGTETTVTGGVQLEGSVKSSGRQSIKRKSTVGDGEEATKRSKQSLTDNKEETPSRSQASKKSKSNEPSHSETPRQQRLSKRLTVKSEEKASSSETPRQRRLPKSSSKSEEEDEEDEGEIEGSPEKKDQLSERSNSGSDEETLTSLDQNSKMVTRGSGRKATGRFVSLKGKASKKNKSAASAEEESKCDVCDKQYSTPQNMRRHRITHSDFKAYKCTFCSQRFHFIQYLREHVVGCLNNPQRVKYRNHYRMRPSPVMMRHLKIVPSPDEPDTFINLPYSKISDKLSEVNSQEEVKNLTAENTEQEILEVLNKVKASQPEVNLQEAKRRHRDATKEFRMGVNTEDWKTEDGQYKCNVCHKIILNQYNLYRHIQTHNESKRYKCTYCGRRFTLGQYLKDHVISCKNNKNRITNSTNRRFIDRDLKRTLLFCRQLSRRGRL
ncbi:zinc finger and SCAN domain-containing protein 12-like [Pecten maximus]|uniref:zinc finger and SCAN domain-containing protein 12-like n=1 Tax=Pecten maximus TaxID=6579 RepID=UPI001457E8D8|nr:zinc finger and SCAN domain-containing protein 12-like [Pecten maximus]